MRNFLTDDSSEPPLSARLTDLPPATEGELEAVRPTALPDTERVERCALTACWAAIIDASEAETVVAFAEVELLAPAGGASSVEDMSSSVPFRLNKDKAEDLVRRWEL